MRPGLAPLVLLALIATVSSCTVQANPSAGVRTDARGRVVIVAPRCLDQRIDAVQVADLDGPVRWRAEGGGNSYPTVFVVGRAPALMQETDPLDGELDPAEAYVATVEYSGSVPAVEVEFRPETLSPDMVLDDEGQVSPEQEFLDEASLECVGGWIWVFGGVALVLGLAFFAAIIAGLWIALRVVRKARRAREAEGTPQRPDLSGR